ncbi:hypothetical protein [Amycolatopsis sp. lyj-112]|uniref:hypothetical protein n=1 Tax=Amycolatopsis sp. lyj-112 TaxID=2789288 RepID=UPI003979956F
MARAEITPENRQHNIDQTYLALRIAMIMLVALLFVTIILQLWLVSHGDCWQSSISAYYFTSVRPVFIGALCAIGACMIIYRGNSLWENTALDYSGFLAFIVAFVPAKLDDACLPINVLATSEIEDSVETNVGAVLAIGVFATIVGLTVRKARQGSLAKPARHTVITLAATLVVLAVGVWLYIEQRVWFLSHGHLYAAVPLFIGIVVVVVANAWAAPSGKFTFWYIAVAVAMGASILVGGILWWVGVQHWALWLEALIIFWYAVFWMVQTAELGGATNRPPSDP